MRVAIDLRCLGGEGHAKRGIGKYLYGMLPALFDLDSGNEYILYFWKGSRAERELTQYPNVTCKYVGSKLIHKLDNFYSLRRTRHIPLRYLSKVQADIFFIPDIFYGLNTNIPTAAVLYDVIPLLYERDYFTFHLDDGSDFFGWKVRDRYKKCIARFEAVDQIISISNASLNDLHKLFPATRNVPSTITHLAAQSLPLKTKKRRALHRYLLYVGGNDHRKGITGLLQVFEELKKNQKYRDLKLVLVGNDFKDTARSINKKFWASLDTSKVRSSIQLKGYVSEHELAELYAGAEIFVFPSQYEGFGLPVIEAMGLGLPVVAYDNSSIAEIAEGAAILARSDKDFIAGVKTILGNTRTKQSYVKKGLERAKQFSWEKVARETLAALQKVDESGV